MYLNNNNCYIWFKTKKSGNVTRFLLVFNSNISDAFGMRFGTLIGYEKPFGKQMDYTAVRTDTDKTKYKYKFLIFYLLLILFLRLCQNKMYIIN